jgi:MoxR-like ATPase
MKSQKIIVGQDEVIDQILICILVEHALVGVPGLQKTLLVKHLGKKALMILNASSLLQI